MITWKNKYTYIQKDYGNPTAFTMQRKSRLMSRTSSTRMTCNLVRFLPKIDYFMQSVTTKSYYPRCTTCAMRKWGKGGGVLFNSLATEHIWQSNIITHLCYIVVFLSCMKHTRTRTSVTTRRCSLRHTHIEETAVPQQKLNLTPHNKTENSLLPLLIPIPNHMNVLSELKRHSFNLMKVITNPKCFVPYREVYVYVLHVISEAVFVIHLKIHSQARK